MTAARTTLAALLLLTLAISVEARTPRRGPHQDPAPTPPAPQFGNPTQALPELGLAVERLSNGSLQVSAFSPNSKSQWIGVRRGDLLLTINGTPVSRIRDWATATCRGYELKIYRPSTGETHWLSYIPSYRPATPRRAYDNRAYDSLFVPVSYNPQINTIQRVTPNSWLPTARPNTNLPGVARGPKVRFLNGQSQLGEQKAGESQVKRQVEWL